MPEVLEKARGAERDYHGNRGDRTKVWPRSADHTRGVPSTNVKSGSPHVGATDGDLSERRGAARAQCCLGREIKGQRGTRSGKELHGKSMLFLDTYVLKNFTLQLHLHTISSIV